MGLIHKIQKENQKRTHQRIEDLANIDAHDIRNLGNDFFAAAMRIAMEAITEV